MPESPRAAAGLPATSRTVAVLATVAYPFAVYAGFGRVGPVWIALALAALLAWRAWAARDATWLAAAAGVAALGAASSLMGSALPLKLYPVLVSAALLLVFGVSLWRPPTVIERIARLTDPQLAPEGVAYTRRVTIAWCVFFVCNGGIALATVLWASDELWLAYNGFVSYIAMGAMFAGEWLLRRRHLASMRAAGAQGE
jgi:uncharacterized membrane protein